MLTTQETQKVINLHSFPVLGLVRCILTLVTNVLPPPRDLQQVFRYGPRGHQRLPRGEHMAPS